MESRDNLDAVDRLETPVVTDTVHGLATDLIQRYASPPYLQNVVRMALEEDLGPGDLTACIFASSRKAEHAKLVAKANGILSGSYLADAVFHEIDPQIQTIWNFADGDSIRKGDVLANLTGPMAALLQGERVALNFLQRLSGIATLTKQFVDIAANSNNAPRIHDTRKTTPLLRAFEKKAITDGGGSSHRFALYDMAMLKDNHIDAAGGISQAVKALEGDGFFDRIPRLGLCIEVRSISEALEASDCRADIIMLDNMTPAAIRQAAEELESHVENAKRKMPELEISGGITLENLREYCILPVQRISVGALTHSAPALDISMLYSKAAPLSGTI